MSTLADQQRTERVDQKSVTDEGVDLSIADGFDAEGDVSFFFYFTKDRDEGLKAFLHAETQTTAAATTSASVRRSIVMRSQTIDGRSASNCPRK